MVNIDYKDEVQLVTTELSNDGFGTEVIDEIYDVDALVIQTTGYQHGNHRSQIVSDAEAYLDPENQYVKDNAYRLEGMYLIANRFDGTESLEWYKIEQVIIGEDKLLNNEIDNVSCLLKKTSEVSNVS